MEWKRFWWSEEKNQLLLEERGVTIPDLIQAAKDGGYVTTLKHPKRSNQRVLVIRMNDYVYAVPFVTDDFFIKTAFPSRKLTKKYGEGKDD